MQFFNEYKMPLVFFIEIVHVLLHFTIYIYIYTHTKKKLSIKYFITYTLVIPILFIENTIHKSTITKNIDTIHNNHTIHIGSICYSYWHQILPII